MDKVQWQNKGTGHRKRLRERFLERGLDGFTDSEVLELLLSLGTPRKDCKIQARELLERFGSFASVLDADVAEIQQVKGVGPKNSFALDFVKSVANRYLRQRLNRKSYLKSPQDVIDFLSYSMRGLKREVFSVIYLDSSHAIIETEVVAEGTINVKHRLSTGNYQAGHSLERRGNCCRPQSSLWGVEAVSAGHNADQ